jgi:sec-independent protein translocase protein TatA
MEVVIVLVIALVILGPKRLPDAGKAIGKGMREFKDSLTSPAASPESPALEPPAQRTPVD